MPLNKYHLKPFEMTVCSSLFGEDKFHLLKQALQTITNQLFLTKYFAFGIFEDIFQSVFGGGSTFNSFINCI